MQRVNHNILFFILFLIISGCSGGGGDGIVSGDSTNPDGSNVDNTDFNWPAHILGYEISFIVEGDSATAPTNIPIGSEVIYQYSENGAVQGTNPVSGNIYYPDSYSYAFYDNIAAINLSYSGGLATEVYELTPTSATEGTYYYTGNTGSGSGDLNNWGRYVILSKGEDKSFTYTNGIKEVTFEWTPLPDTTYARLLKDPDGSGGVNVIDGNITQPAYTMDVAVHLHDYRTQPKNGQFILEVCNASDQCTEYNRIPVVDVLIGSIARFVPKADERMGQHVVIDSAGDTLVTTGYGGLLYRFDKDPAAVKGWKLSQKLTGMSGLPIQMDDAANRLLDGREVYSAQDNKWTLESSLTVNKTGVGTYSAEPVGGAISGNGLTIALMYTYDTDADPTYTGMSVFIFQLSSGTPVQKAEFFPETEFKSGQAGKNSLELSPAGLTLLVNSPMHINPATSQEDGAIFAYDSRYGTWQFKQTLTAPNLTGSEQFGYAVSLAYNGHAAVVLATRSGDYNPETYLMIKDYSTWTWTVSPLGSLPGSTFPRYTSIALSGDGNIFVAGNSSDDSPGEGLNFVIIDPKNQNHGTTGGAAVYRLNKAASTKTLISFLKPVGEVCCGGIGRDVSINGNGDSIAVSTDSSYQVADEYVNPETLIPTGGVKGSVFLY